MNDTNAANNQASTAGHDAHRADLAHYWARLMWYRDELWRITTPVWGVYGAFIASCVGYVWSSEKRQLSGEVAGMLIIVVIAFSWVIQRMYWTYAHRIYAAINDLNKEVQKREQHIYQHVLKNDWEADYARFRVYPELNVIFSIVGVAMTFACIFIVASSVGFVFDRPQTTAEPLIGLRLLFELCFGLLVIFEMVLLQFKKRCEVCGVPHSIR